MKTPTGYYPPITASCDPVTEKRPVVQAERNTGDVTVGEEVAEIAKADSETIRERYRQLFGVSPGELGTSLLRARVAYAIQEARTGLHLTVSETAALEHIAKSDPIINPGIRTVAKAKTYRAGKTWTRVYRGVRHAIRADGRGRFIYDGDGETYASPTAFARRITGTHISGRAFFGIND